MRDDKLNIPEVIEKGTLSFNVPKTYLIIKRVSDLLISLIYLTLFLFILIITIALIKLASSELVFTAQEVYGCGGKKFKIVRFNGRNIYNGGIKQKTFKYRYRKMISRIAENPFLNKTLQIFNVIEGDMSIVGPMPKPVEETEVYKSWYSLRLSAKPGITGLWQVSRGKSDDIADMITLDLKYIRERSILLDFKIVIKSFFAFFIKNKV